MIRLIVFELEKIWRKRSFVLSICALLTVHLFLLWYVNLPDDETPPLGAYKAFSADVRAMSEEEKGLYIIQLKEKMDGISLVQSIQNLQANGGDMETELAQQKMNDNRAQFEKYYDFYQSGDYLLYTDSLSQETALVNELFDAYRKVADFPEYLDSVVAAKNTLSGISVFGDTETDSFSSRNIIKSARDYAALHGTRTNWQVDKGIVIAMENRITDILLFLAVFLFVGGLITEEKEKGLFYITRATKNGLGLSISGKLGTLLVHCTAIAGLMLGANLLFAVVSTGVGNLSVSLQSLAPYVQSPLPISVLEYLLLSAVTKVVLLFVFGAIITTVAVLSNRGFLSHMIGIGLLGISFIAYTLIPVYSALAPLKYINFWGIIRTEFIYGDYLNLNIADHPVSVRMLCGIVLGIGCVVAMVVCITAFLKSHPMTIKRESYSLPFHFHPHGSLLRHEAYKLLIANRGIWVLLCFALLLAYQGITQEYHVSGQEQYYQRLMLRLEGELSEEKIEIIQSEQIRFDEATEQIARIDALVDDGQMDSRSADLMKQEWEAVLFYYPAFERVLAQYENVQNGGSFVYDTGYLYLLGKADNSFLICLLLLSICMVIAFYNGISIEWSRKAWYLLGATRCGKKAIIRQKAVLVAICAAVMAVLPWIFRTIGISSVFPMSGLLTSVTNIPALADFPLHIPLICFIMGMIATQMLSTVCIGLGVLGISAWRKNEMQALFFSLLLLVLPLVLKLMGFDFVGWLSTYPIYKGLMLFR